MMSRNTLPEPQPDSSYLGWIEPGKIKLPLNNHCPILVTKISGLLSVPLSSRSHHSPWILKLLVENHIPIT